MDRSMEPSILVVSGLNSVVGQHSKTVMSVLYVALYVCVLVMLASLWDRLDQFVIILAMYFTLAGNPLMGMVVLGVSWYKMSMDPYIGTAATGSSLSGASRRARRSL